MSEPETPGKRQRAQAMAGRAARAAAGAPKQLTIGYFRGLKYPFRGMKFVFIEHGRLVKYWGFPIFITFLLFIGLATGSWVFGDDVANYLIESDAWYASAARGILFCCLSCLSFVVGTLLIMLITSIIAAPFNSALSEEVERIVTGKEAQPFNLAHELKDVVRTVLLELVKVFLYLMVMGSLFVLSLLIPVVGSVLDFICKTLFTTLYLGLDYIDWPAARRELGIRHRFGIIRRHFLPMFGFGSGAWLFLCIPFVNLVFMPAAVAGGTLLYLDLVAQEGGGENGDEGHQNDGENNRDRQAT